MARIKDFTIRYRGRVEPGGTARIEGIAAAAIRPARMIVPEEPSDLMMENLLYYRDASGTRIDNLVAPVPVLLLVTAFGLMLTSCRKGEHLDARFSSVIGGEFDVILVSDVLQEEGMERILPAPWMLLMLQGMDPEYAFSRTFFGHENDEWDGGGS